MQVLHVTECYAGGVRRAIESVVASTPDIKHALLWTGDERPGGDKVYSFTSELPSSALARVNIVKQVIAELKPDVIHAHSSWAGLYTRVFPSAIPVIYQPHCYAFSDPNRPRIASAVYWIAERILARNTHSTLVLTQEEEEHAKRLAPRSRTVLVNNVSSVRPLHLQPMNHTNSDAPIIAMSGRICPQKDPDFYIETAELVRRKMPSAQFQWLGDGEGEARSRLEAAGINVSGWLDSEELRSKLESTVVYFHSALYEGFPLSVLEAAAFRLPIVVRDIPAFRHSGLTVATSSEEAAERILNVLLVPGLRQRAIAASHHLDSVNSNERLSRTMNHVYFEAIR